MYIKLEGIMLSEMSQAEKDNVGFFFKAIIFF